MPVARGVFGEAEQVREPRLDKRALVGIEDVLLQRGPKLLGATQARPPHRCGSASAPCRQAPRGHTLAVGEAAAAVPVRQLCRPSKYL